MRKRRWLRRLSFAALLAGGGLAALSWTIGSHGRERLAHPPSQAADAALVLGNRAYLRGHPNPCLTGRVDTGVQLAQAGLVPQLFMSGGVDREDGRVEAEVMAQRARQIGYAGAIVQERASSSTRENLALSRVLLEQAGVKRVIVVSEPYHLWRVERLARASGFDGVFEVQYAAAPTACWQRWGMLFKGALREPLAAVDNALLGYF